MIQILPQDKRITPDSVTPQDAVTYINEYIGKNACKNLQVDISFMNILDACYVATLCSTTHYIKYPNGKINWKISSKLIKELNKDLELGNVTYEI